MSTQLHKNFTNSQVKSLFEKYSKKEIKLIYILQILRIKRSRFFELLTRYRKDPDMDNQRMEGVLKLDDNSLYYENLLNVKMTSYGSQVSHYALAGMVMSIVLFFACSCIIIKMGNSKNFRSAYLARLSLYNLVELQLYLRIHIPPFKRNKYQIFTR